MASSACLSWTTASRANNTEFVLAASRRAESATLPPPPATPPSEDEVAAITAQAREHGIELLGPPGTLPGEGQDH